MSQPFYIVASLILTWSQADLEQISYDHEQNLMKLVLMGNLVLVSEGEVSRMSQSCHIVWDVTETQLYDIMGLT